jgi:hypothetical protein
MHKAILTTMLAVGAVTAVSTVNSPAQAQYLQCDRWGRGCVPATQASYNACYNLAIARGESPLWGERRKLDWFIFQCLAGRIPR